MKNKESLVLLCGLLCDERVWKDVSVHLEDDYNISIISFKGCDTIEQMAKKVLNISFETFYLIGHSMGGRVALEVYNQNSNRIKGLGLFNTGVHPKNEAEVPGRLNLLELANDYGMGAVVKQWLPPMMSKKALINYKLMEELEKMVKSYTVEDFEKQINALLNRPDAHQLLPYIYVPTLLLSASEDKWSPISQHKNMQIYLKNSDLYCIEDAGHMVICEKPNEIATIIKKWLEKI